MLNPFSVGAGFGCQSLIKETRSIIGVIREKRRVRSTVLAERGMKERKKRTADTLLSRMCQLREEGKVNVHKESGAAIAVRVRHG